MPSRTGPSSKTAAADPALRRRAQRIYRSLQNLYPDVRCELDHQSPFQLLIATILSAQCTDKRVNMVTPALFARFPDAHAMAEADLAEVEQLVKTTGFFRNKARNIVAAATRIVEVFDGEVPQTMDELLTLPGVARKTANVVLGNAFNKPVGVVVDTHVQRLSRRLGLTSEKQPVKIERDLMGLFKQSQWNDLSHLLIWHGRRCCDARKPDCEHCILKKNLCPQIDVTLKATTKTPAPKPARSDHPQKKTGRRVLSTKPA